MTLYQKIVCPVDFSEMSKQCVNFALKMAAYSNGRIALVHMVLDPWADMYYQADDKTARSPAAAEKNAGIFCRNLLQKIVRTRTMMLMFMLNAF